MLWKGAAEVVASHSGFKIITLINDGNVFNADECCIVGFPVVPCLDSMQVFR